MSDSTAAPPPMVRFAAEGTVSIELTDPLEIDRKPVASVQVGKLTIGAYRRHTESGGRTDVLGLPMFFDEQGQPLPAEVVDALSFRDGQRLTEVATSFLNMPPKAAAPT